MAKRVNPTRWQWLFVACKGRNLKEAQITQPVFIYFWVVLARSVQYLSELRQEDTMGAPHY